MWPAEEGRGWLWASPPHSAALTALSDAARYTMRVVPLAHKTQGLFLYTYYSSIYIFLSWRVLLEECALIVISTTVHYKQS